MLTQEDLIQLEEQGVSKESVMEEIGCFEKGFPFLRIVSPATVENGIFQLSVKEQNDAISKYDDFEGEICKFVPASGAATRMFKDLYEGMSKLDRGEAPGKNSSVNLFFHYLGSFAFYNDLTKFPGFDIKDRLATLKLVLLPQGLNYGSLPKGLIKFHKYLQGSRTAFEEHLVEAALYSKGKDGISRLVVTVAPEHLDGFRALLERARKKYESRYDVEYDVKFTIQKQSTDTIAVDDKNNPFRKEDGSLVFRPAGHGALIENLNELTSDIIIIKNIDNVVKEQLLPETIRWKKILGGVLISVKEKINSYLRALDGESDSLLNEEIINFLEKTFCIRIPSVPDVILKEYLRAKLDRPVRVCGMVKNLGEPGGGPYIVYDADGATSLQILESAQLDKTDPRTKEFMRKSTHFNPVDLVCSFKDYNGNKYDLHRFIDPETGFISNKSLEGRPIKALELPGLWNGAMSQWNTVFIEVPVVTFNPVKTVIDLLRPEHLSL